MDVPLTTGPLYICGVELQVYYNRHDCNCCRRRSLSTLLYGMAVLAAGDGFVLPACSEEEDLPAILSTLRALLLEVVVVVSSRGVTGDSLPQGWHAVQVDVVSVWWCIGDQSAGIF